MIHVKGVYFVPAVMNATMSTLLCHLCCYQNTLLVTRTAFISVVLKSIDMKSSWMVCDLLHYHLPVLLLKTQETHDRNAGRTCASAANYCAERGKNGLVKYPQAG